MAWTTIDEDDVRGTLTAAELSALRSASLATGQADPIVDAIARVVADVRGYVGACRTNSLGAAGTIPEELRSVALDLVRWRLITRLPLPENSPIVQARQRDAETARSTLREVAACRYAIEQPASPAGVNTGGGTSTVVSFRPLQASRAKLAGLI